MEPMSAVVAEPLPVEAIVIPYSREKDSLPKDLPALLYRRLVDEDLLADLVPEYGISEKEFVDFVTSPSVAFFVFLDAAHAHYAGLAWVSNIEQGDWVTKGAASVCFFKEYRQPKITRRFGWILLGQLFNVWGFSVLYGLTPASNKAAARYTSGLGFTYRATLPQFTSRRGELNDARICTITRDEFNSMEME